MLQMRAKIMIDLLMKLLLIYTLEKNERIFKVEKMISKFELDAVKDTKAKHLSGGQRKKVSIAMSLMSDPKIILMDKIIFKVNAGTATTPTYLMIAVEF